jgi:hypothetical protein
MKFWTKIKRWYLRHLARREIKRAARGFNCNREYIRNDRLAGNGQIEVNSLKCNVLVCTTSNGPLQIVKFRESIPVETKK